MLNVQSSQHQARSLQCLMKQIDNAIWFCNKMRVSINKMRNFYVSATGLYFLSDQIVNPKHTRINLIVHTIFHKDQSTNLRRDQWHTHGQKKYKYKYIIYIYQCIIYEISIQHIILINVLIPYKKLTFKVNVFVCIVEMEQRFGSKYK